MTASHGHGHGHGHGACGYARSSRCTQKQAKEPDVKDEPLFSDPVTITEEEDEDETVIKIKVNQPCIQKARRGKPFKPAGRGIRKNDEVKACLVQLDRKRKKDSKVTKETETQTDESMITKTDIGTSTSEEQPLVPEYLKDEDNCESEENKLYEKNTDESTEK